MAAAPGAELGEFDTVILAGGRAARMNFADKPGLVVGDQPMLVSVAMAAAAAGTRKLIMVGPRRGGAVGRGLAAVAAGLPGGLITVREDPAGHGPVPALRCGLDLVTAPWLMLLAADLPFLTGGWLVSLLSLATTSGRPGAMLADESDRPQWLASCWQAELLRLALLGYSGDSLGALLRPLSAALLRSGSEGKAPWRDCDSPAELTAARSAYPGSRADGNGEP